MLPIINFFQCEYYPIIFNGQEGNGFKNDYQNTNDLMLFSPLNQVHHHHYMHPYLTLCYMVIKYYFNGLTLDLMDHYIICVSWRTCFCFRLILYASFSLSQHINSHWPEFRSISQHYYHYSLISLFYAFIFKNRSILMCSYFSKYKGVEDEKHFNTFIHIH